MSRFVILAAFLHFSRNNKFHYPYVNTLLNAQTHTNAVTDTHIHALMCNCITVSLALCWRACTYAAARVCVFFFSAIRVAALALALTLALPRRRRLKAIKLHLI